MSTPVESSVRTGGGRTLVSLQYLRAGAALLVVYLHATIQFNTLSGPAGMALEIGKCGVDVFFVLSGYVMWMSTAAKSMTVADFLKRRLVRIVPLYWIMTSIAAAVAYFLPQILKSTKFEIHHVIASLLFIPWPNPVFSSDSGQAVVDALKPVITPGWTLNFEMFFYVLFAIALWVPKRSRIFALVLIIGGAFLVLNALAGHGDAFQFYGSGLIFEFLAGTLLGALEPLRRFVGGGRAALPVLIAALFFLIFNDARFPSVSRTLVLGPPAAILLATAVELERAGRVRFLKLFDELGNASYSIYVTHIFVVAGLRIIPKALGIDVMASGRIAFMVMALAIASLVGIAVHEWVEKPVIKFLNHGRLPLLWKAPAAGVNS